MKTPKCVYEAKAVAGSVEVGKPAGATLHYSISDPQENRLN